MSKKTKWIEKRLRESSYRTVDVYAMHEEFQSKFESDIEIESYKRCVRNVRSKTLNQLAMSELAEKQEENQQKEKAHEENSDNTQTTFENSGNSGIVFSKSNRIKTLEQLIEYCEIDLNEWDIYKHVINKWEVGAKDADKNLVVSPLFQVKAWMNRKVALVNSMSVLEALISDAKKFAPVYEPMQYKPLSNKKLLYEVCIPDLHFGQLSWKDETGDNYDIKIAEKLFLQAIEYFAHKVKGLPIFKIFFPTGNDFFNVNNQANTTTKGTPQDEDCRWQKTFVRGRKLLVKGIDILKEIAPVEVMIVAGNHDEERMFYLGDALECWYNNCQDVIIDNSPKLRKYFIYGKNFICLTHGNKEPKKQLPIIAASEAPRLWGEALYREIHIAHTHHEEIIDVNGTRIRTIPTFVGRDSYHAGKGYTPIKEAKAFVWDNNGGIDDEFYYRP